MMTGNKNLFGDSTFGCWSLIGDLISGSAAYML